MTRRSTNVAAGLIGAAAIVATPIGSFAGVSFVGGFTTVTPIASTVPGNGDVNPYGVVVVPRSAGALVAGDILISNFNASSNFQGTGTTLVELSPSGQLTLFSQIDPAHLPGKCPGGVGLTTALGILPDDYVVVGSLPTTNSGSTIGSGCLLVLDSAGTVVDTVSGGDINGPWDLTLTPTPQGAAIFVTNVLNGTVAAGGAPVNQGTVVRVDVNTHGHGAPKFLKQTVIGSGFGERTDTAALVVGPTGVGLGSGGTLYVADSVYNRIAAIPDAVKRNSTANAGNDVSVGGSLNDPLGLTIAPNGDIVTTNGDDGLVVETTPQGAPVAQFDTGFGGGSLFGLAVTGDGSGLYLVDDGDNTLAVLH